MSHNTSLRVQAKQSLLALMIFLGVGLSICFVLMPSLNTLVNWALMATLLAILVILVFFFSFESVAQSSKEIALISMLATMSAVLRIPFGAIPSFQPCTFLIICSGYVFGPVSGFMVGAMTPLISNFFLGQGPWTLYQMLAWGLIGCGAGYLGRFMRHSTPEYIIAVSQGPQCSEGTVEQSRSTQGSFREAIPLTGKWLVSFGVISAFMFGLIMNVYFWLYFAGPLTLSTLLFAELSSFWFDVSHAVGNAIFLGLFGTRTIAIMERYKKRFTWVYQAE
jgi:energy-coupling factor transport system substrate-specific component